MKKRGRKKHTQEFIEKFQANFLGFLYSPFYSDGNFREKFQKFYIFEVNSALGCKLHIFIQLPHSRFLSCARIEKNGKSITFYSFPPKARF